MGNVHRHCVASLHRLFALIAVNDVRWVKALSVELFAWRHHPEVAVFDVDWSSPAALLGSRLQEPGRVLGRERVQWLAGRPGLRLVPVGNDQPMCLPVAVIVASGSVIGRCVESPPRSSGMKAPAGARTPSSPLLGKPARPAFVHPPRRLAGIHARLVAWCRASSSSSPVWLRRSVPSCPARPGRAPFMRFAVRRARARSA
jgi:hypothetical protein